MGENSPFIQQKPYLREISRVRVSEGRNLEHGLRLDRNEKVDVWPENFLKEVLGSKPPYFLSVYPETGTLYKKLSKHLGISEDELLLTSGIDGGLKTCFEIITSPGDTVGVLSPTYAMYWVYSKVFQVKLFEVGYREDLSINREQLEECIAQKPKILFVPNPNQPIESSLSLEELTDLAKKTRDKNCLLLVDEAYYMFGCDTALSLVHKFENVVVARTFSKGFGVPSIRLGYLVSNPGNMSVLSKTRFAHESNALSNAVAEYLLDNYSIVENYIQNVIEGRNFVKKELAQLGIKVHGNKGNYLLIDLENSNRAKRIVDGLKDQLVYVKGPWASPWDKYITITLGPVPLMTRFMEALRKVLD